MIPWIKRLLLTFIILGLLFTSVLTLTSTALNAALSGFVNTALGVAVLVAGTAYELYELTVPVSGASQCSTCGGSSPWWNFLTCNCN